MFFSLQVKVNVSTGDVPLQTNEAYCTVTIGRAPMKRNEAYESVLRPANKMLKNTPLSPVYENCALTPYFEM